MLKTWVCACICVCVCVYMDICLLSCGVVLDLAVASQFGAGSKFLCLVFQFFLEIPIILLSF